MMSPTAPIHVRIFGGTDVGLVREHNEDSFLIVDLDTGQTDFSQLREYALGERGTLLLVCDGMGGAAAGEVASHMAVEGMRRAMCQEPAPASPAASDGGTETVTPSVSFSPAPLPGSAAPTAATNETATSSESPAAADSGPTSAQADAVAEDAGQSAPPTAPSAEANDGASEPDAPDAADAVEISVAPPAETADTVIADSETLDLARRLRTAAQQTNREIFDAACADIAKAGMGTTLTAVLLLRSRVLVAQVGDSRAYLWRQGKLTQITHDQSLVNQLLDSGQITPEQAKLFEHSNVILQALGVQEDVEVVLSTEQLRRDDRLLLCSDGLVGVVTDEEIQEILNSTENLEEGVRALIDMARAGGGPDNITVLLAQATGEGLAVPGPEDQVAYRALALDPPSSRRSWSSEVSYGSQMLGGRDAAYGGLPANRWRSPLAALSMAWVLGLAVAGLVIGILYYPQRGPRSEMAPLIGPCAFLVDRAGLNIVVDDKTVASTQPPSTDLKLAPGEHLIWLSDPQDGTPRSEKQALQVMPGQRCVLKLHVLASTAVAVPSASASASGPPSQPASVVPDAGAMTVVAPSAPAEAPHPINVSELPGSKAEPGEPNEDSIPTVDSGRNGEESKLATGPGKAGTRHGSRRGGHKSRSSTEQETQQAAPPANTTEPGTPANVTDEPAPTNPPETSSPPATGTPPQSPSPPASSPPTSSPPPAAAPPPSPSPSAPSTPPVSRPTPPGGTGTRPPDIASPDRSKQ